MPLVSGSVINRHAKKHNASGDVSSIEGVESRSENLQGVGRT